MRGIVHVVCGSETFRAQAAVAHDTAGDGGKGLLTDGNEMYRFLSHYVAFRKFRE
jgi:hypothetical protein